MLIDDKLDWCSVSYKEQDRPQQRRVRPTDILPQWLKPELALLPVLIILFKCCRFLELKWSSSQLIDYNLLKCLPTALSKLESGVYCENTLKDAVVVGK